MEQGKAALDRRRAELGASQNGSSADEEQGGGRALDLSPPTPRGDGSDA